MTPPVMNKSHPQSLCAQSATQATTNSLHDSTKRKTKMARAGILIVACALILSSGCRQPVANSQSGRPALFDFSRSRIFGNGNDTGTYSNQYDSSRYANRTQQSYLGNQPVGNGQISGQVQQQYAQISNEVQRLNQRIGAYDSDNQLLNTEVAALTQKLQLANQYNQTLKDQLSDNSNRIQLSEMEKQAALQQLASAQMQYEQLNRQAQNSPNGLGRGDTGSFSRGNSGQSQNRLAGFNGGSAPTQFSGATIRANNSLMQRLSQIQIPGGQARMDGDVIRIEFPSDRMFVPGTYQIQPAQLPVLQNIAGTIRNSFAKNIVGIEAHWDGTPLNPSTTTHHQLTATQSLAVFDNLVRLGLPKNQLFTMAMASNRPRHPQGVIGGVNPNRRIELVIYPETYDGSF